MTGPLGKDGYTTKDVRTYRLERTWNIYNECISSTLYGLLTAQQHLSASSRSIPSTFTR
jgi:hypothetical protein